MSVSASTATSKGRSKRRTGGHTGRPEPSSLLPASKIPEVEQTATADPAEMDALLVIVPDEPTSSVLEQLPDSERWQELNARSKPRAGTVRTTVLTNKRQTTAVLGYIGAKASTFERLSLAGRMFKAAAARNPKSVGLLALRDASSDPSHTADLSHTGDLDALLAAGLASAFQMPAYRSKPDDESGIERLLLIGPDLIGQGQVDIPYGIARARGTTNERWLTALPPNKLDSRGYHATIAKLARNHKLGFNWYDEAALKRLGANAFLAVSAANANREAGIAHL